MNFAFKSDLNYAKQLDESDELKSFRSKFFIPDNTIYLDGNSLGRLPLKTKELISEVTEYQWGNELIESWNKHWYNKSSELGNKIAKIIGATDGEVIVTDSTSTNLYKLAHAALTFQKDRIEIISDEFNFPTDLYILQGLMKDFGDKHELILAKSSDGISMDLEDLKSKITENTALVTLSLVAFKSSFLYNAKEITKYAQSKGALVLWDLSHAAGAIPINLNEINADLAVGCTYKFLNGGPGSPAFLYVREDLQEKLNSPIQGWFGDKNPFEFKLEYRARLGIKKFLAGTPPVISQMAIEPGIDIVIEAGISNVWGKSKKLSEYFLHLFETNLVKLGYKIGSPLNANNRGSHITLKHKEAYRICQALIHPKSSDIKIIPDFREPDNIRFGFTPLYTTYTEVWQTSNRLKEVVEKEEFELYSTKKQSVT